jgi:sugar lactone lactonase YvrE
MSDSLIGHGDFRYEVDSKWGRQNPYDYPVDHCHEMVQDAQGRLLLLTTARKNNMLIYDRDGKIVDSWTLNLPEAHGLTITGEGSDQTLWITCSATGRVLHTDLKGQVIQELKLPQGLIPEGMEYKPTETTVAPDGSVYVADGYGSNLILKYGADGRFQTAFGGKGEDDDQFDCCHGITIDTRDPAAEPTLLITSRSKQAFKRFTLAGKHLETIALPGLWICRPVIDGRDLYFAVIVTESWWNYDGMLAVLNTDNQLVSLPGGSAPIYEDGGFAGSQSDGRSFLNPHDVCVDTDGNLYVPQWYSGRTYPVRLIRR